MENCKFSLRTNLLLYIKMTQTIQTLFNLPTNDTPTKVLQKPSTDVMPLQIFALDLSSPKVESVLHYGDPTLDEEIIIPKYDYATITLEHINIMQEALERKKKHDILRNEYKKKKALHEIKYIFLDAFSLQTPDETKPILEKLSEIVDRVTSED